MNEKKEHDNDKVLEYWNRDDVESMYDKVLINSEIELIKKHIPDNSKILDAGCGEGEGTFVYSSLPGSVVHAVDFSEIRLRKAAERLADRKNIVFKQVDFLKDYELDNDFDVIVSQRFMINLMEWELQKKVILDLMSLLKSNGRLIMVEGSMQGVDSLNLFRNLLGLEPIPVKWHNLFFDDDDLVAFMRENRFDLKYYDGLGTYFLLTRGIRPYFDEKLDWNCDFNYIAADHKMRDILGIDNNKFSRIKLWVFGK